MPGLGISFGRGGATTFLQDLENADVIVVMGSNMAECHPVGFQYVMNARTKGATVIHVDPRFTRTSAVADRYVPIRPGTDIAFLGGLIRHILETGSWFDEYVKAYTNAATIVDERFVDTEDLGGLFSGWDPETKSYDPTTWQYAAGATQPASQPRAADTADEDAAGGHGAGGTGGDGSERDETLEHPRCVFQILRRHYARYTPEMVERVCGTPRDEFLAVAEALCENSGRERTGAFVYSVGWTQHTVGVQYIRAASIVQLLLGNVGRPGGGVMALRGHASIQGSTDIPTLYDLLPGYIPMPRAADEGDLDAYVAASGAETGHWGNLRSYLVSLLKSYFGDAATAENDFCFDHLPRIDGDHSVYHTFEAMIRGNVEGYFLMGENPAVGSANGRLHRFGLAALDWLVVRDFVETESASFWLDGPEIETGEMRAEEIGTEVFLLPAATHVEKSGTFTQTQRLLQWHDQAVEPPGDARSDLWFMFHLGRILREKLADSNEPRDRPLLDLTWDYPTKGEHADPEAEAVLAEINGFGADGEPLATYMDLRDDGSTRCGCWIYSGCFADGVNQTRRRRPWHEQSWVAPEWGWAWPLDRRMLYNRASADLDGQPWSERKRYVWWDADAERWTGHDVPDIDVELHPHERAEEGSTAHEALSGDDPFIMQADGKGWLFAPAGLQDGPLPTHYEAHEAPVANQLYEQPDNPATRLIELDLNPTHGPAENADAARYPFVLTSYRLTEHHTAGAMSRYLRRLSELMPEPFCEIGPELAEVRGVTNGQWVTIVTARSAIEARALVTRRIPPFDLDGRRLHQVCVPYHWGTKGLTTGDSANDLFPVVLDPNVMIQEVKAATCDLVAGRRPRGPELRRMVEEGRR